MSSLLLRMLLCDGCGSEFGDVARTAKTLGEVRKLAASAGWEVQAHTHGEDVCPTCRVKRITEAAKAYRPAEPDGEEGDADAVKPASPPSDASVVAPPRGARR